MLDGGDIAQMFITVSAIIGALLAYKRGIRQDKSKADLELEAHSDQHQIDLIRVTQETQQAALTTYQSQLAQCGERAARLEGRVDELTRERAADRAVWEQEKRALRHEIGTLKVSARAAELIIERQDNELAFWRERVAGISDGVAHDMNAGAGPAAPTDPQQEEPGG